MTAFRPLPGSHTRLISTFETPSATNWSGAAPHMAFVPNCYVDISATINKKIEALKIYQSEMREFPHARSIESVRSLSRTRGAEVGMEAAEAFCIVRKVLF
jgi:hypothetical protein